MTNKEKAHLNSVASLGCILCRHLDLGETPAEIHHPREDQGMGERASHWILSVGH